MARAKLSATQNAVIITSSLAIMAGAITLCVYMTQRLKNYFGFFQIEATEGVLNHTLATLRYVRENSRCALDCLEFRMDPWGCFDPRNMNPSVLNCSDSPTIDPPQYHVNITGPVLAFLIGALVGVLYPVFTKASHRQHLVKHKDALTNAIHDGDQNAVDAARRNLENRPSWIEWTFNLSPSILFVTFALSVLISLFDLFAKNSQKQATCLTLREVSQFTYKTFSPQNFSHQAFFPACWDNTAADGSYLSRLNRTDFSNFIVTPVAPPIATDLPGGAIFSDVGYAFIGLSTSALLMTMIHAIYSKYQDKKEAALRVSRPNPDPDDDNDDDNAKHTPMRVVSNRGH